VLDSQPPPFSPLELLCRDILGGLFMSTKSGVMMHLDCTTLQDSVIHGFLIS
jgi:hypothetical protein